MPQWLSLHLRTHILELTRDRAIRITAEQYRAIKASQAIDKWNDPLVITDPETKKVMHDWLMKDILGFQEVVVDRTLMNFVCDFANRHPVSDTCTCKDIYGIYPFVFAKRIWDLFKKNPSEITQEQKNQVHESFKNQNFLKKS